MAFEKGGAKWDQREVKAKAGLENSKTVYVKVDIETIFLPKATI